MKVDIVIMTWPSSAERLAYLEQSLDALQRDLMVSDEYTLNWRVSSETQPVDGVPMDQEQLRATCAKHSVVLSCREGPPNLGNHLNDVLRQSTADFIFLAQDDRILGRPLDLSMGLQLLEQYPRVAAASYCMTDGADSTFSYHGRVHGFGVPAWCSTWRVSDVQMLVPKSFHARFGPYLEDAPHGEAERALNRKLQATGTMSLMSPTIYFDHVGLVSANGEDFLQRT